VVFLEDTDYLRSVGQRVRVAEGKFAGVEGVVKRIKSNKCVVVRLEGIAAVAILRFPVHALIKL
jgi:transcription antitermination factor NusG